MKKTLAVLAWLLTATFTYAQVELEGSVVDSISGKPLPFAVVHVNDRSTLTDSEGLFKINNLPMGRINLHIDYVTAHGDRELYIRTDTFVTVQLSTHVQAIDAVLVTHSHDDVLTGTKQHISRAQLERRAAVGLDDALGNTQGVHFLKTGHAIAKPVINGMHSNRIAIVVSDSKLEGQQWGVEHAPALDPMSMGRIEVIRGASTLLYANDALGGVIRVVPFQFADTAYKQWQIVTKLGSNPVGGLIGGQYETFQPSRKLGHRITLNAKRTGDSYAPGYVLSNTGYGQLSGSYHLTKFWRKHKLSFMASSYGQKLGILSSSHIGNLTDLERALESDTPLILNPYTFSIALPKQHVQHHTAKLIWEWKERRLGDVKLSYTQQYNRRSEFDKHGRGETAALKLNLLTSQGTLFFDKHLDPWRLEYGGMVTRQQNTFDGRYFIPNYIQYKTGLFGVATYKRGNTHAKLGLRYDRMQSTTYRYDNDSLKKDLFLFDGISATASGYKQLGNYKLSVSLARKFRTPAINELFSEGLHHGAASLEFGDQQLQNEVAYSFNALLQHSIGRFKWSVEPYMYLFKGYINLEPTGETQLSIRGAFPVFKYTQRDVRYTGLDINLRYHINSSWNLTTQASLIQVVDSEKQDFIFGIPAPRIRSRLMYYKKFQKVTYTFALKPSYTFSAFVPEARNDLLDPPSGYFLADLELSMKPQHRPYQVLLEARNLLNTTYRDYLNRYRYFADEQGIQLFITLHYKLRK